VIFKKNADITADKINIKDSYENWRKNEIKNKGGEFAKKIFAIFDCLYSLVFNI
jgi:hypothetical protein